MLKSVGLQDFSFQEISTASPILTDNANRNVIHHKLHDPHSLNEGTHAPEKFDDDLIPQNLRRQVLVPLDFTKDWERERVLRRDRVKNMGDDDDEFDYEEAVKVARQQMIEEEEAAERQRTEGQAATAKVTAKAPSKLQEATTDGGIDAPAGFMFRQAQAAADAAKEPTKEVPDSSPEAAQAASGLLLDAGLKLQAKENHEGSITATTKAVAKPTRADEFIPQTLGQPSPGYAPETISSPEETAAAEYKKRLAMKAQAEEDSRKMVEELKAQGYRDGYALGEEKGTLAARAQMSAMFGKMGELFQELNNLKRLVLENVQDNFYEICQGMAEALLRHEFTVRPEAFITVLRRAIDEAVEKGSIKVKMHPDTAARIEALGAKSFDAMIIKDPTMDQADFRIESDLSVVEVSVHRLVKDLLEQADLNIIEQEEKAG